MNIDEARKNQKEVDRLSLEEAKKQILERYILSPEEAEKREGILRCFIWDVRYYEQALKLDEVKAVMAEKQVENIKIEIVEPGYLDILDKYIQDVNNGIAEWNGEFEEEGWD